MSSIDNLNYSNAVVVGSRKSKRKSKSKVGNIVGVTSMVAATAALDVPKRSYSKFFKGDFKGAINDFTRFSEIRDARIIKALGLKIPKNSWGKSGIALAADLVMFAGIYTIGYFAGAFAEKFIKKQFN